MFRVDDELMLIVEVQGSILVGLSIGGVFGEV